MNELTAKVSPNPIFTALLQEDPAESATRQLFGQLEAGRPIGHLLATPGVVHDPKPPVIGDPLPYRASAAARPFRGGPDLGPPAMHELEAGETFVNPVARTAFTTFVSTTPTGSINLNLRKALDQ